MRQPDTSPNSFIPNTQTFHRPSHIIQQVVILRRENISEMMEIFDSNVAMANWLIRIAAHISIVVDAVSGNLRQRSGNVVVRSQ